MPCAALYKLNLTPGAILRPFAKPLILVCRSPFTVPSHKTCALAAAASYRTASPNFAPAAALAHSPLLLPRAAAYAVPCVTGRHSTRLPWQGCHAIYESIPPRALHTRHLRYDACLHGCPPPGQGFCSAPTRAGAAAGCPLSAHQIRPFGWVCRAAARHALPLSTHSRIATPCSHLALPRADFGPCHVHICKLFPFSPCGWCSRGPNYPPCQPASHGAVGWSGLRGEVSVTLLTPAGCGGKRGCANSQSISDSQSGRAAQADVC
jgi:hypothetical protein